MSSDRLFNNIGIHALALNFVLSRSEGLSIPQALLIAPIISHQGLLNHLARKNTSVISFEKYLIENISFFSNFNDRFYSLLPTSINAMQLLHEIEMLDMNDRIIKSRRGIEFSKRKMGQRAEKIYKAASNIYEIVAEKEEVTYLNLRIEL